MPKGYKISSEKKAQIIEMSLQGFTPCEINQVTDVNTKTIRNTRYRYFKERPELKEASKRRMIKRSQRQGVPKVIRQRKREDEKGPITRTMIELIGDRHEYGLYYRAFGWTLDQFLSIKEEGEGYDDPDLEGYAPVTKVFIKRARALQRAKEQYYYR